MPIVRLRVDVGRRPVGQVMHLTKEAALKITEELKASSLDEWAEVLAEGSSVEGFEEVFGPGVTRPRAGPSRGKARK